MTRTDPKLAAMRPRIPNIFVTRSKNLELDYVASSA